VGVLAGGRSLRMGQDKALLEVAGKPLLQHLLDRLGRPALISAKDDRLARFGTVVKDILLQACPLAGIHALLIASPADRMFICACDMPFVSLTLAEHLATYEGDLVLPVGPNGDEPLHAVYSKICIEPIESCVRSGGLKTSDLQWQVRTSRVDVDPARWLVDGRSPFTNVNSPDELGQL